MPLFGFESDALVSPWSAFKVNEAISDSSFQTFIIKNATVYLKVFNPNVWGFFVQKSFFFFFKHVIVTHTGLLHPRYI